MPTLSPSRIDARFRELNERRAKGLVVYLTAGDPTLEATGELLAALDRAGVDVIELGVPFSDPLADGPTIQRAAERALKNGVTLRSVIATVKDMRKVTQVPLVLMTYFNPVFKYGTETFIKDAKDAGVDGVIIPDLPPDEAGDFIHLSKKAALNTIFLLAPTSTEDRIKKVSRASSGFIYYVSITGTTGANLSLDGSIDMSVAKIRGYTDKPVAVGFGVSTPEEASAVAGISDGVIVGSAIVKRLHESPEELKNYLIGLREAIK
jgi:tryptophan synthase alpha chain